MNNMKEVKIIQSKTEPNKNHLWLSDEGLKQFKGDGWEQVLSNDGGGNVRYYDVSGIDLQYGSENFYLISGSIIGKAVQNDTIVIMTSPLAFGLDPSAKIIALAIDLTLELYAEDTGGKIESIENLLKQSGVYDLLLSLPTLTKEQFYDLTLPTE